MLVDIKSVQCRKRKFVIALKWTVWIMMQWFSGSAVNENTVHIILHIKDIPYLMSGKWGSNPMKDAVPVSGACVLWERSK